VPSVVKKFQVSGLLQLFFSLVGGARCAFGVLGVAWKFLMVVLSTGGVQ